MCLKIQFSTSFQITLNEAVIYTENLLFHRFHSLLLLVNKTGEVIELNWQAVTKVDGMKNAIMQVTYFIVTLFHIKEKWLLKSNLVIMLPLKSSLSGKFQSFSAIGGSIEKIKNSCISINFSENQSLKTFYEAQTTSCLKDVNQPPTT